MLGREDGGLMLRDVTAGYEGHEVLRQVTLSAPEGELTGIIGPNGSGKTTLVRVASRGLPPLEGVVSLRGQDPYMLSPRQSARLVAVVPQEVVPAFPYSVLEMVLMGRSPYQSMWGGSGQEDWAKTRWAMRAVSVQHLADRPFDDLSAGERQRVILAQALAQDAPILLLDEPTTHLDVRHVVETLAVVKDLARAHGKAVLAVFHDLNLASSYCDRIHAIAGGRVVASGPPGSVLTRAMMMDVFGVEAEISPAGMMGRPTVFVSPPVGVSARGAAGDRAHVIGGAGRGASVIRSLVEAGYEVTVGVLHGGDTDEILAERLDLERVAVPPFSEIDPISARDCWDLIERASVLVVCDPPFGPGNVENLRLAVRAAVAGVRTFVLEQVPIEERDFTGGEATTLWRQLRSLAQVAGTWDRLVPLVEGTP